MEDVSSAKVCDEDGFVFRGMTIEAHGRGHEGANLDHSRHQQHRVEHPRGVPELRLEHYQVGVSDGMLSLREICFRI